MEIINHECYVSLEVAKLLKEAGFDWKTEYAYVDELFCPMRSFSSNFNSWGIKIHEFVSAPTLDVAQRWLREVKKIHIEITFGGKWIYTPYNLTNLECLLSEDEFPEIRNYNTYEEALEAGIKKALEIILEK
jgi:hypothetical protein